MRSILLLVGLLAAALPPAKALAWGEPGHQLIGSIAWNILNQPAHKNAKEQVAAILGKHSLAEAATWADCVRDVGKVGNGFKLTYDNRTPLVCIKAFPQSDLAEVTAMEDYVKRNWSQCDYSHPGGGMCHATYHFEDIPFQHGRYTSGDVSTSKHDVVAVIREAVAVLKTGTRTAGSVVNIVGRREALFLLAHMIGDIHQPLHVGAVYLDANGTIIDPGHDQALADRTTTKGGNLIVDGASQAKKPTNLHHEWDELPPGLSEVATGSFVSAALSEVTAEVGADPAQWPEAWASESVALARDNAFKGVTFSANGSQSWKFVEPSGYDAARHRVQEAQLKRAGVRLARMLVAIWPD